ncbi:hypothetical protein CBS147343_1940 [Aspergillus niger]|nr:hypothetical protein CBS133816_5807 [Aspergillus niger]KAI2855623.1 hypothetical protein CBS12448_7196 [Aspergillus niger]KAI2912958.1 hypothetical protein CBS147371_7106 [Aspergillus niger]KAI2969451.1 hypothetical protein CBS147324_5950 [Aspergillus niger]KAI3000431.1 hypothetical protein CBS147482_7056 [Aspergillus niger]
MCGRYALGVRMSFIRRRLQDQGLQVDDAPPDEDVRETYNFAPGNSGAVYLADTHMYPSSHQHDEPASQPDTEKETTEGEKGTAEVEETGGEKKSNATKYKLHSMRWGLIPFWTKRNPDYGSIMRTINCRDDSLIEDRGLWTSMKRRKRCVVVCQGFYEWLKKGPGGKEKVPHFVKRKDGELMYFAGLWDSVKYEDSDDYLYTYTIITTSSNSYLKFLHDRMPVILDPNSEQMKTWLDPSRTEWSKELQSILKPYEGELECYPVPKEVGKVGNNSPDFIVPVSSKENKSNIANFFANAKKGAAVKVEEGVKDERPTKDAEWSEDNAPKPVSGVKREHSPDVETEDTKLQKTEPSVASSPKKSPEKSSPSKPETPAGKKMRSATHNKPMKKSPQKQPPAGTQRITNFFGK